MEKFEVGDIVLVLFPFSNLKGQKLRPALILAKAEFNNLILCQITSKPYTSRLAIKLTKADFVHGGLPIISYIRPDKLFTADKSIIYKTAGTLTIKKKRFVLSITRKIFI
ncbi:type II toxin-antitoxin system PemK/MazF family toxin [Patescibacteria group bacterium]|nr:type II toxin-antitoxin system PemK/MazF family toxin [Patescibacteria group bacterium]